LASMAAVVVVFELFTCNCSKSKSKSKPGQGAQKAVSSSRKTNECDHAHNYHNQY
jgi:hypothetical protein